MRLKRAIYGLPLMKAYRRFRTRQLAARLMNHFAGFKFAGTTRFFDPRWEREERAAIEQQLEQVDVFVDVGANQGLYACLAAQRGKQVIAIEPEEGNLRFLLANIVANDFKIEVFATALGRASGAAEIYGDGDTASLVPGWAGTRRDFAQTVPLNTLDNLVAHRWPGRRMFIKMDVEGFELLVLQGSGEVLRRDPKPAWLIETFPLAFDEQQTLNANFLPLFELMFVNGYTCTHAQTGEAVAIEQVRDWAERRAIGEVGRSNYLFRPI